MQIKLEIGGSNSDWSNMSYDRQVNTCKLSLKQDVETGDVTLTSYSERGSGYDDIITIRSNGTAYLHPLPFRDLGFKKKASGKIKLIRRRV